MAKAKKNKALPLLLLGAAAAALLIGYRVLTAQPAPSGGADTADTQSVTMILSRSASDVAALTYTFSGETTSLVQADGAWQMADDASFPLNAEPVSQMAAAIASIGVYRTLDTGDTGEFGFDAPAAEIDVTFTDGEAHRYAIGDVNPMSGNRYFLDRDSGTVYMIAPALLSYFRYTAADLFVYETLPDDIDAAYIDGASLTENGETRTMREGAGEDLYTAFRALVPMRYADYHDGAAAQYSVGASSLTISYKRAVTVSDESGNENTTRIAASYTVRFGEVREDGTVPYTVGDSAVVYLADTKTLDDLRLCFD